MRDIVADVPANSTSWLQRGYLAESLFGPPASMDFFEDNYAHSDHVAELFNSLSSAYIISIGLIGVFFCSPRAGNEARYKLYYGLIALVGLGSMTFHGTLRQYAQALDELPMLWGGLTTLWVSLFYHAPNGDASARQWAWGFVGFGAALTALYLSTWRIYMIFLATYALAVAGCSELQLSTVFPVVSYKSNPVKTRAAIDNLGNTLLGGTVRVEESAF
ncbi:Alkaline ceramidase 3 [Perkinsus olseni]|uniref:Alkaline ceramidase 3 n=1 Tax=Perkinsus olseni TaxID=32597 RepID=A0A7J6MQ49_PEROL|nr:Alkaline ceramidase 3 [Perkinsus olseni]